MYVARTFRMSAAAVAAVLTVGTFGATAAHARPAAAPTGLAATVAGHPDGSYDVAASWNANSKATSYRVTLTKGGATLASAKVPDNSWSPTITATPGTASLNVRTLIGKKPGRTATFSFTLPDVVAPTGTFVSSKDEIAKLGTITQTALSDDAGTAGITRTVDWGDGTPAVIWTPGDTQITRTYLSIGRYVPTVTLTDASDNSATFTLGAIVLGDVSKPTGSVAVGPSAAWASFTHVVATPSALADDISPQDQIAVHVSWGDGTSSDSAGTATLHHVYALAGPYDVVMTITDEAGNPEELPTSQVVVTADETGPRVKLTLPKAKHSVKAWKTLRGKATDAGTGVKSVRLKAVEKRGASWFGYRAGTHTWVKAGSKAKAFSRARAFTLTTNAKHQWAAKLAKLRKGTLVYKVRATDQVHNRSVTATHKATLTRA